MFTEKFIFFAPENLKLCQTLLIIQLRTCIENCTENWLDIDDEKVKYKQFRLSYH